MIPPARLVVKEQQSHAPGCAPPLPPPSQGGEPVVVLSLVWRLPFAAGFACRERLGLPGPSRALSSLSRSWLSNTPGDSGSSRMLSGLLLPPYNRRLNALHPNVSFQGKQAALLSAAFPADYVDVIRSPPARFRAPPTAECGAGDPCGLHARPAAPRRFTRSAGPGSCFRSLSSNTSE